jgi:predicted Zn-dependent peptidase
MHKRTRTRTSSFAVKTERLYLSDPFREKLSNGITLIGESIPFVESVAIGVWVNVGSRDEPKEKNGITHLIEHMVFKGTKHFSAEKIVETVERRGGYINAFTTKEFSCYYAKVFKDDIETTIQVLADLLLYPNFSGNDLENERKVVLSELQEVYDDPEDWGMDFVEEKIFAGNPLAMPVIGDSTTIKRLRPEDLHQFHLKNFRPDRIVLSAAGNFNRTQLTKFAEKYFSQKRADSAHARLTNQNGNLNRKRPPFNPSRKFTVRRKDGNQAHLLYAVRGPGLCDPERYAASMVGIILGDGSSSRLYKNVREEGGLAYSIYSYGSAYSDSGILGIYACTPVNEVGKAEDRILNTIDEFVRNGPTDEEVERGRAQLKAGIIFSLENLWDRASLFARDELYYKERYTINESLALIDKVTNTDVAEAAIKCFMPQNGNTLNGSVLIKDSETAEYRRQSHPNASYKPKAGISDGITILKILPKKSSERGENQKGKSKWSSDY